MIELDFDGPAVDLHTLCADPSLLPAIGRIEWNSLINTRNVTAAEQTISDQRQLIYLLYSARKCFKVSAAGLRWNETNQNLEKTGAKYVIPVTYPGWFRIFLKDNCNHNQATVNQSATIEQVIASKSTKFLVQSCITGFWPERSTTTSDKVNFKEVKVFPGEVLNCGPIYAETRRSVPKLFHCPCPLFGKTKGAVSTEIMYLECTSDGGLKVLLPLETSGQFSHISSINDPLDCAPDKNMGNTVQKQRLPQVFPMNSLVDRDDFPQDIQLVHGTPPSTEFQSQAEFSSFLKLEQKYCEDSIIACQMNGGSQKLGFLEFPVNSGVMFTLAKNWASLQENELVQEGMKFCQLYSDAFQTDIQHVINEIPQHFSKVPNTGMTDTAYLNQKVIYDSQSKVERDNVKRDNDCNQLMTKPPEVALSDQKDVRTNFDKSCPLPRPTTGKTYWGNVSQETAEVHLRQRYRKCPKSQRNSQPLERYPDEVSSSKLTARTSCGSDFIRNRKLPPVPLFPKNTDGNLIGENQTVRRISSEAESNTSDPDWIYERIIHKVTSNEPSPSAPTTPAPTIRNIPVSFRETESSISPFAYDAEGYLIPLEIRDKQQFMRYEKCQTNFRSMYRSQRNGRESSHCMTQRNRNEFIVPHDKHSAAKHRCDPERLYSFLNDSVADLYQRQRCYNEELDSSVRVRQDRVIEDHLHTRYHSPDNVTCRGLKGRSLSEPNFSQMLPKDIVRNSNLITNSDDAEAEDDDNCFVSSERQIAMTDVQGSQHRQTAISGIDFAAYSDSGIASRQSTMRNERQDWLYWKTISMWVPPQDLTSLTVEEVAMSLRYIGMRDQIVSDFSKEQIDGKLLCEMNNHLLQEGFPIMNSFERKKVLDFVQGWRPKRMLFI